jgi:hypothetical protein
MSIVNITAKAQNVARIFDTLAWVVLIFGGLTAGLTLLVGLFGAMADGYIASLVTGIIVAVGIGIYTALLWASITLGTIIAGYIANKSE